MNEVTIFENEQFGAVRTMMIDDEPWFVAADVCKALEYTNVAMTLNRLDDDEKGINSIYTPGGMQNLWTINESGLYRLVLGSRKPEAKEFKRWVVHDVLPSIRKHGLYATDDVIDQFLEDPRYAAKLFLELAEKRDKVKQLEAENEVKDQQIMELQPKATYYDTVLQSTSLLSTTEIAKDFRMTAQELNNFLEEHGVQFKRNGVWLLYKKYAERGYTQTKTYTYNNYSTSIHTYWTQAGRLFIYELLKQNGILPTVELE